MLTIFLSARLSEAGGHGGGGVGSASLSREKLEEKVVHSRFFYSFELLRVRYVHTRVSLFFLGGVFPGFATLASDVMHNAGGPV